MTDLSKVGGEISLHHFCFLTLEGNLFQEKFTTSVVSFPFQYGGNFARKKLRSRYIRKYISLIYQI